MSSPPPEPRRRSRSPLRNNENNSRSGHRTRETAPSPIGAILDMNNIRYEFMPGQRMNSKMLHTLDEHQLYKKKIVTKHDTQYECYKIKNGCPAKVSFIYLLSFFLYPSLSKFMIYLFINCVLIFEF